MSGFEHLAIVIGSSFAGSVAAGMLLVVALPLAWSVLRQRRHRADWIPGQAPRRPAAR